MRLRPVALALLTLALILGGQTVFSAQEQPLAAGSEGVPVPKQKKHVQPIYPPEALAQGIRGIVILDLVIDAEGRVTDTTIIRSIPGLDEAALAAAHQWRYEPVKVNGETVSVRLTVPITFALKLPEMSRQEGIPELRQGVTPSWPAGGAPGGGLAVADVTLEPDGRIGLARIIEGEDPWSASLLQALRTWRFRSLPDDVVVSFRVNAQFLRGGPEKGGVELRLSSLRETALFDTPGDETTPVTESDPAPAKPAPQAEAPAPPELAEAPSAPTPDATTPAANPETAQPPLKAQPATQVPGVSATSDDHDVDPSAPPPIEVLAAVPPPLPPENGISAIRGVELEPGVPDLTRGRRPVAPPLARMAGTNGVVTVEFSVSAGGITTVQRTDGPEVFQPAATQAVESWVFRRTRAARAYLTAEFTYEDDLASAVVRPQPES